MPIIVSDQGVVTQINVITVEPGGQDTMIAQLERGVAVARDVPGWRSASLHRSLDGTRVVNYAQSADLAAAEAVIARLRDAGMIARNAGLGTAHPGLYEVVRVFEP
jgi:hypothetical protein